MNEKFISECIKTSKENKHSFSEFLFSILKDQVIEIYVGDSFEEIHLEQSSSNYPAVFVGKFIGAYGECIILDSIYVDQKEKTVKSGNLLFIHEKSVKAIDIADSKGTLQDMFCTSKDVPLIKSFLSK